MCNGTDEFNQDDDGAVQALLAPSQLSPGDWATAELPPCPWALSADELLGASRVPCRGDLGRRAGERRATERQRPRRLHPS